MKKLLANMISTLLLASVSASAASSRETIVTQFVLTKAAAYEQGANKLSALNNSSPSQLRRSLSTPLSGIELGSLELKKGGYVRVQQREDASGKIGYVGIVEIEIDYKMYDSDK